MPNYYIYIIGVILACLIVFISYRKKLTLLAKQLEEDLHTLLGDMNLQSYIDNKFPDTYPAYFIHRMFRPHIPPIYDEISKNRIFLHFV